MRPARSTKAPAKDAASQNRSIYKAVDYSVYVGVAYTVYMNTTTVRISTESHRALRQIAEQENTALQDVIDRAIELYRRDAFFRAMAAAMSALTPAQIEAERLSAAAWDVTLADGLDR